MTKETNYINLFPTTIYQKFCDLDLEKIEKACYAHKKDNPCIHKSNIGGYQGENFICEELYDEIKNSIPKVDSKPIHNIKIYMWLNINKKNNRNAMHHHSPYNGVIMSGVYYVKCPKNCGDIEFYDPRLYVTTALDMQYYNDGNVYWSFEPKENMMMIFPSWLHHAVSQNKSDEDRISIGFNIGWDF